MAIWPFNRREKTDEDYAAEMQEDLPMPPEQQTSGNMPEEVQEYYESGRRERVGVAWLLGLGTLLVTVLLALGIFFGGRWLYRTIKGNNDKPQSTAQIGSDQEKSQSSSNSSNSNNSNNNSGSNNSGSQNQNQGKSNTAQPAPAPQATPAPAPAAPAPTPAPTTTPSPALQTTPTPSSPASGSAQGQTPTTTAPTTPIAGKTPNTGPGNVLAIAAIAGVISSLGYYAVQLKRQT